MTDLVIGSAVLLSLVAPFCILALSLELLHRVEMRDREVMKEAIATAIRGEQQ